MGKGGVFWLYAFMGVLTWLFVVRLVPETKGKTLAQIQASFADRGRRKPPKARAEPAAAGPAPIHPAPRPSR
jgi:hypothetical protein